MRLGIGTIYALPGDMLDASTSLPYLTDRRHPRYRFARWVQMHVGGETYDCFADDISIAGARLENVVLAPGEHVTLHIALSDAAPLIIKGIVVWANNTEAGLRFLRSEQSLSGAIQ